MRYSFLLIPVLVLSLAGGVRAVETRVFSWTFHVSCGSERALGDMVGDFVRGRGGYMRTLTDDEITVRLAPAHVEELKSLLSRQGHILDEQIVREDAGEKLADLAARLAVKEKLLGQLYALFDSSPFHQTLEVENEIGRLITEIEAIKGEMAFHRDRVALAVITIHPNVLPGSTTRDDAITFDWVRELGLPSLLEEKHEN